MYTRIIRPILFQLPPETAHHLTLKLIGAAGRLPPVYVLLRRYFHIDPQPVRLFGLTFHNRIGLAAGYDKDAESVNGLSALGFGHIEIGTITPKPQPGNPKPRVFRLVQDQAVINRMGFPGKGAEYCLKKLEKTRRPPVVIGVNIGINKNTPLDQAAKDYTALIKMFGHLADYFTINISSPNTSGLRDLQTAAYLHNLLGEIDDTRQAVAAKLERALPILVKLSPDLSLQQVDEALDIILTNQIDGVIASNTTLSRINLKSSARVETGGLSGVPLQKISTELITHIHNQTNGSLPIIGVGGIMTAQDARKKLEAGASLIQIYTGLIYKGPRLVQTIARNL